MIRTIFPLIVMCLALVGCRQKKGEGHTEYDYLLSLDDRTPYLSLGSPTNQTGTVLGLQVFDWIRNPGEDIVSGVRMRQYDSRGSKLYAEFELYCSDTNREGNLIATLYDANMFRGKRVFLNSMQWSFEQTNAIRAVREQNPSDPNVELLYSVWRIEEDEVFPYRISISLKRSWSQWCRKNAPPPWHCGR